MREYQMPAAAGEARPETSEKKVLRVSAGILTRNGRFFAGCRASGHSMAGKWEFPGGKIEENETPEECIVREIREELHVPARVTAKLCVLTHDYDSFTIELHVFMMTETSSAEPYSLEHRDFGFRTLEEILSLPWDPCDIRIMPFLKEWISAQG